MENIVCSNQVHGNQGPGITLHGSDDNDIHDNRVWNNRDGIMILMSGKNRFSHNQVRNNARYGIAFPVLPLPGVLSSSINPLCLLIIAFT
jgi:parallel beta-helix repeat protein